MEIIEKELAEYNINLVPQIKISGDPKTKSGFFNPQNLESFLEYINKKEYIETIHFHGIGYTKERLEDLIKEQIKILSEIKEKTNDKLRLILNLHIEALKPYGNYGIVTDYSRQVFLNEAKKAKNKTKEIVSYGKKEGILILIESSGHVNFAMCKNRKEQEKYWPEWYLDYRQIPWLWIPSITQEGDFLGTKESQIYFEVPTTLDLGHVVKTIIYSKVFNENNINKKIFQLDKKEIEALKSLGFVKKNNDINGKYELIFNDNEIIVPEVKKEDYLKEFGFYIKENSPIIFKKEISFKDLVSNNTKIFHLHSETGAAGYCRINLDDNTKDYNEIRFIPSHAPFIKDMINESYKNLILNWIPNVESAIEYAEKQEYWLKKIISELKDYILSSDIILEVNVPPENKNQAGPVYLGETYRTYIKNTIKKIINEINNP